MTSRKEKSMPNPAERQPFFYDGFIPQDMYEMLCVTKVNGRQAALFLMIRAWDRDIDALTMMDENDNSLPFHLTNAEIAEQLNCGRTLVSQLLNHLILLEFVYHHKLVVSVGKITMRTLTTYPQWGVKNDR